MASRPFPVEIGPEYVEHVEGLRRGELVVRRCRGCSTVQWPPRAVCGRCRGVDFAGRLVDPIGQVHTFTVVHRAFHPWFAEHTPYAVAVVDLAEGIRMTGFYDGDHSVLACGLPVVGRVEDRGGAPAVVWSSIEDRDA
jgi:uncharacterized protein